MIEQPEIVAEVSSWLSIPQVEASEKIAVSTRVSPQKCFVIANEVVENKTTNDIKTASILWENSFIWYTKVQNWNK